MQVLEQVFARLASANLTLNLAKCDFGEATVTYLERHVGQQQVRPVKTKVSTITKCPAPTEGGPSKHWVQRSAYRRLY